MTIAAAVTEMDQDIAAILREQTEKLLSQVVTPALLAEADGGHWPAGLWSAVEAAGLPLALVPEEAGGIGLAAGVAADLLRLSAFHGMPVPLAETVMAQALWTASGGTPLEGALTLAPDAGDLRLTPAEGGFAVAGRLPGVPWGARADHILALCRGEGGAQLLCLPPSGRHVEVTRRTLANEPRDTVSVDLVVKTGDKCLPLPAALDDVTGLRLHGAFLRAQQMVGAMERALDFALAYANERKQFGRPIGRFQAVQHMLAVAAGECAAAGASARLAAAAWDTPHFAFATAVAKARVGEAAGKVAETCHQVHGAMGFTHEHPLHFFTRRLWAWRDEFGHEAYWQERIGRQVCANGGAALWPALIALRAGR